MSDCSACGQFRNRMHRRDFHLARDGGRAAIERAAENKGKAQDVVDLVRIIRAAGRDDRVGTRPPCTSSGRISGVGLASAKISGRAAIASTISGFNTPPADRPRKMSAPGITSARVRASVFLANRSLSGSISSARPLIHHAGQIGDQDVFDRKAQVDHQVQAGQCCRASAADDQLDIARYPCRRLSSHSGSRRRR